MPNNADDDPQQPADAMSIPTLSELRTTVFRILFIDGKRRGEYRMICIAARTRVEYPIWNELGETVWVSTDEDKSNQRPGQVIASHDCVVSLMNRLIAFRAGRGEPLHPVVNDTGVCEIDLGTIDFACTKDEL